MLLTDKLALVTGGGRGLGAAISKGLAAEGARVVVVDLNADNARGIAEGIEADGDKAFCARRRDNVAIEERKSQ